VIDDLPAGQRMVIRALPGSRAAASTRLAEELRRALSKTQVRESTAHIGTVR
jgi:RNase P protein component